MRLYLLRHGEVDRLDLHYGHTDVPLSNRGQQQAEAAANALDGVRFAAVYSSDLSRAVVGAELLAARRGLRVHRDAAWREVHLGLLEGLPHAIARQRHPTLHARGYADLLDQGFPGGESLRQVAERVAAIFSPLPARHRGETVAIVAHNSVNRILLARALRLPLSQMFGFGQNYGCVNRIDYDGDHPRLGVLNWTLDAPVGRTDGDMYPP